MSTTQDPGSTSSRQPSDRDDASASSDANVSRPLAGVDSGSSSVAADARTPKSSRVSSRADAPHPNTSHPNTSHPNTSRGGPGGESSTRRRGLTMIVVLAGALVTLGGAAYAFSTFFGGPDERFVYYTVKRGELTITVTERGTLESQENVRILNKVDDVRGDQIDGAAIVWIIPNGASVKKDDLLVELATASYQEQLDRQILAADAAQAEQIKAKAKYENQITQNQTTEANANLEVRLAELSLEMFSDDERGTHQLEVQEIKRTIDDTNNEILAAQAALELKKNDKMGIEAMFKLGYAGKNELDRYRLEFLQAEGQYAAKLNRLSTHLATLKKKETYEHEMQSLTLQGSLATAKRNRDQVVRDNQALLDQAKAAAEAADRALKKENELLSRYREQLANCKIHAPQDGMVVYAVADSRRWWMGEIREGGTVRPRQHILSLPNLKRMEVKTSIHESVLEDVKKEMPATIRIEAFPDRGYPGQVKTVAVMADQQGPDVKVYKTVVTIDGDVKQLKPGMTAVVDIHVDRLKDVLSVPVQAIVQVKSSSWCYVARGRSIEKRAVKLGRTNDEFVEVVDGIKEGERVVLNTAAVVDEAEEVGVESPGEQESMPEQEPAPDAPNRPRNSSPRRSR